MIKFRKSTKNTHITVHYKCFDLFLLNHHKTIANGVFIRDLCLLRENNIVDDDHDLTSTELTYMIDFLCTL